MFAKQDSVVKKGRSGFCNCFSCHKTYLGMSIICLRLYERLSLVRSDKMDGYLSLRAMYLWKGKVRVRFLWVILCWRAIPAVGGHRSMNDFFLYQEIGRYC